MKKKKKKFTHPTSSIAFVLHKESIVYFSVLFFNEYILVNVIVRSNTSTSESEVSESIKKVNLKCPPAPYRKTEIARNF